MENVEIGSVIDFEDIGGCEVLKLRVEESEDFFM